MRRPYQLAHLPPCTCQYAEDDQSARQEKQPMVDIPIETGTCRRETTRHRRLSRTARQRGHWERAPQSRSLCNNSPSSKHVWPEKDHQQTSFMKWRHLKHLHNNFLSPVYDVHSFVHSSVHSFIRSFINSLVCFHLFVHFLIHPLVHSSARSFTGSFVRSIICAFFLSFVHSSVHLIIRSLVHLFILSFVRSFARSEIH